MNLEWPETSEPTGHNQLDWAVRHSAITVRKRVKSSRQFLKHNNDDWHGNIMRPSNQQKLHCTAALRQTVGPSVCYMMARDLLWVFNKKSELMFMRRATASVESAATSGICVQRAIMRFEGGAKIWRPRTVDWSKLRLLKSTFNAEIPHAGCFGLSPVISAQFTLELCVASWKNSLRPPFLGVEGRSTGKVVSSACHKYLPICNCSHARRVNSGKITIS